MTMCDEAWKLYALAIAAKGTPEQRAALCRYLSHRLGCDECPRTIMPEQAMALREGDRRTVEEAWK